MSVTSKLFAKPPCGVKLIEVYSLQASQEITDPCAVGLCLYFLGGHISDEHLMLFYCASDDCGQSQYMRLIIQTHSPWHLYPLGAASIS